MNCPSCQTVMREREQVNVIIDICPNCRGVFLDAGELEKLGERERRYYDDDDDDDDDDRRRSSSSSEYSGSRPPQKKKSVLSSMFENVGEGGD